VRLLVLIARRLMRFSSSERSLMRSIRWQHAFLTALVAIVLASPVSACPNCKEAVSAPPEDVASMARGYNWSIMLMLGAPVSLLTTGAFMVRRAVKLGTLPEL
jgi:hypothetical protein